MFLFVLYFFVNHVMVSSEVITLTESNNITCILNGDSVNSAIYISSLNKIVNINRKIEEINITDWESSSNVSEFTPIIDQRWTDFSIVDTFKIPQLKNIFIFSLCRENHTYINISTLDPNDQNYTVRFEDLSDLRKSYTTFCKWNHYVLQKHYNINQSYTISLYNFANKILDTITTGQNISSVTITGATYAKIHNYSYNFAKTVSTKKSYVALNNWKCVSFYASIDEGCYLNITVESGNKILNQWPIEGFNPNGKFKLWKKYNFSTDGAEYLTFGRFRNDHQINGFWAIDEVQKCDAKLSIYKEIIKNSADVSNYICKTLEPQTDSILSNEPCNASHIIGTFCNVSCGQIFGPLYPSCEKQRICLDNSCYCAWGHKNGVEGSCKERCDGKNNCECNRGCEDCDFMKRCIKCEENYLGTNCSKKLPVVQKPPKLIDLDKNYIRINLSMEYDKQEIVPDFYHIQFKKFNSSEDFKMYEKLPYITDSKKWITNINLTRSDSYKIRILLESNETDQFDKNIPELIIYQNSLNFTINNNGTTTLTWKKPQYISFKKYILNFQFFCPNNKFKFTIKNLTDNVFNTVINSTCNVELFIETKNNNELIDRTVIDSKLFPINDQELPKTVELKNDQILFDMEACETFRGPLDYIVVVTCLNSWCNNISITTQLSLAIYNETLTKKLENLNPYTLYHVNVTAKRLGQIDKQRIYRNIKTSPGKPEPVRELFIYSYNVDEYSMGIKWLAGDPPTGIIEKYYITFVNNNGYTLASSNVSWPCELWDGYICGNLTFPTITQNYKILVAGKNYNVTESSNPSIISGTFQTVSTSPGNLEAKLNSSLNTLYITWEHPLYTYGTISCFFIKINSNIIRTTVTAYQKKYNESIILGEFFNSSKYQQSYNISVWANSGEKATILVKKQFENLTEHPKVELSIQNAFIQNKFLLIIIITLVITVAIIIVTTLCIFYCNKKGKVSRKKQKYFEEPILLSELKAKEALLEENCENKIYSRAVCLKDLEQYVFSCLEENSKENEIANQFQEMPKQRITDCKTGQLVENIHKNRYKNIIPYDDTRVILNDNENSNYINANYINGYEVPKEFIATQAPLESTIHDFWQMVCQEKVDVIIMLTELKENGKLKSEKYWPEQNSVFRYGQFLIENISANITPNYIQSTLLVRSDDEKHLVQHYQYMTWPDHGIPISIHDFTNFLREIINIRTDNPMIVHCNAGCGRTGVFILSNICIKMATKEKRVDFPKVLKQIRDQRLSLIINVDQYIFCHFAVIEFFFGQDFSIKISDNFQNEVEEALDTNFLKNLSACLEKAREQHEKLHFKRNLSLTDEEKMKNRFPIILPGCTQIFLPISSTDSSNYINAVTVDCYRFPKKFIVTQQPLPNTIEDFWKVVKEFEIETIISLNQILEDDPLCPKFWPNVTQPILEFENSGCLTFLKNNTKNPIYNLIKLKIESEQNYTKIVNILDVKNWKRERLQPPNIKDLISIWKKIMTSSGTIMVTCYDGATASGLFVALAYLLEKINMDHTCDVFEAVKIVQKSRPQFVEYIEQLKFLYLAAIHYIDEFSTYGNFT